MSFLSIKLTRKLAYPPKDYKIGDDDILDEFISQIQIAFDPKQYNHATWQGDLEKILHINANLLQNEYNLGLVTGIEQWSSLLANMRHDGRACYVGSHNHAIAVAFENGEYVIYDPNYDEDKDLARNNTKQFKTARDVIIELKKQFGYKDDNIGLRFRIFSHPDEKKQEHYPDKKSLHSLHLGDEASQKRQINITGFNNNTADFALLANDEETLRHLFENHAFTLNNAIKSIILNREISVLEFTKKQHDKKSLTTLIRIASRYGTSKLLSHLLDLFEHEVGTDNVFPLEVLLKEEPSLLDLAIESKSKENVKIMLAFHKKHHIKL